MAKAKTQSLFDQACAGLRATGAKKLGQLGLYHGNATVFERQTTATDRRNRWFVSFPDGKIWFGATFATKQNPGAAIREAILAAGVDAKKSKSTLQAAPTLAQLGLA